jgi:hypothetical protein
MNGNLSGQISDHFSFSLPACKQIKQELLQNSNRKLYKIYFTIFGPIYCTYYYCLVDSYRLGKGQNQRITIKTVVIQIK